MRLVIRDGVTTGGGCLSFDLQDVLAALGVRASTSGWYARHLNYISNDDRDVAVMQAMASGTVVNGRDVMAGIEQLSQVIGGEFVATDPGCELPWVIVRAVDSSWWEVVSDDAEVLEVIRKRFRDVEEHEHNV